MTDTFFTRPISTALPTMGSSVEVYTIAIAPGTAPTDAGFINPQPITGYGVGFDTTPSNFNLALSTANRRGNLRYREVINQLQLVTNCYVMQNTFVAPNGTILVQADSLTFKIWIERGGSMATPDELNPGITLLNEFAVERCVARAMTADLSHRVVDIFNPTPSNALFPSGNTVSAPRSGVTIGSASGFSCGPYYGDGNPANRAANLNGAAGLVTVTPFVF